MMIFSAVEQWMLAMGNQVPLEIFLIIGEILEELISPIPSQAVLFTAGTIADAQGRAWWSVIWLSALASLAKTATTMFFYWAAEFLERVIIPRFGKYLGLTPDELRRVGERLSKRSSREFLTIFALRSIPFFPSVPISIVCGLIEMRLKTFISATLLGNFVRSLIVIGTGYAGLSTYQALIHGFKNIEDFLTTLFFIAGAAVIVFVYWKRRKLQK